MRTRNGLDPKSFRINITPFFTQHFVQLLDKTTLVESFCQIYWIRQISERKREGGGRDEGVSFLLVRLRTRYKLIFSRHYLLTMF